MSRVRAAGLALLAIAAPVAGRAESCDPVRAAYEKYGAVSALHQSVVVGVAMRMELVVVDGTMWVKENGGSWAKLPATPGMLAQAVPDLAGLRDCRETGREALGGVATTAYAYLPPSFAGETPVEQTVWIGDADGLPYRMTTVTEDGPMEMTLAYDGVTAPE